jgi:membrane protease YdiL (CAAX protease family)
MGIYGMEIEKVTAYVVTKSAESSILALAVSSGLSLVTLALVLRKSWKKERTWRTDGISVAVLGVAIFIGIFSNILVEGIVTLVGSTGLFDSIFDSFEDIMNSVIGEKIGWGEIIAMGILGPVVEEIIFRGAIFSLAKKAWGYTCAIFLSAILFGVMHLIPLQIMYATALGILYGYIFKWTKRLWVTVICHVVNNVFTLCIGMIVTEEMATPTLYVVATMAGLAATVFSIFWLSRHQTPEDPPAINLDPTPGMASN